LATRPVIEQSKGILIAHFGIDPAAAFDVLKRWSSHTNLKVRDVSQILVTTATANPPSSHRRAIQELIYLIECLNKGQIPIEHMNSDQTDSL
jgi:ANTAR domain